MRLKIKASKISFEFILSPFYIILNVYYLYRVFLKKLYILYS